MKASGIALRVRPALHPGRDVARDTRGGVLMEYVLVTCLIMLPLIGFTSIVAAPGGRAVFTVLPGGESSQNFGVLGQAFVDACRLLLSGVSLPIP